MLEIDIMKAIQLEASRNNARLFRNNTGQGWVGKAFIPVGNTSTFVRKGDVVLYNARPLHAGLCVGSSDLIGWRPLKVTKEMVGMTIAVFTAIEVKAPGGFATTEQQKFISVVNQSGGTGAICMSKEEFRKLVEEKQ